MIVREEVGKEIIGHYFPPDFCGSCGISSTILARVLRHFKINAKVAIGYYWSKDQWGFYNRDGHAFVLIDNCYIVDITASQFGDKQLVITSLKDNRYEIRLKGDKSVRYDFQEWNPKQRPQSYNTKEIIKNSIMRIKNEYPNKCSRTSK